MYGAFTRNLFFKTNFGDFLHYVRLVGAGVKAGSVVQSKELDRNWRMVSVCFHANLGAVLCGLKAKQTNHRIL